MTSIARFMIMGELRRTDRLSPKLPFFFIFLGACPPFPLRRIGTQMLMSTYRLAIIMRAVRATTVPTKYRSDSSIEP